MKKLLLTMILSLGLHTSHAHAVGYATATTILPTALAATITAELSNLKNDEDAYEQEQSLQQEVSVDSENSQSE